MTSLCRRGFNASFTSRVDDGAVKATRRGERSPGPSGSTGSPPSERPVPAGDEAPWVRRSFVVSVSEDADGALRGVVEAVRTGRKETFRGLETLGSVIETMFRRLRGEGGS